MFFEGSEKKAEIIVDNSKGSLRKLGVQFWTDLVFHCQASILSTISNDECDAYLLSESSLFVWDDRFTILTCGQTLLVDSVIYFVENYEKENIQQIIFQRKNEYFSHLQKSNFLQDIEKLKRHFKGSALRFGHMDDHHNFLYHLDSDYTPCKSDTTFELLLYHISNESSKFLTTKNLEKQQIRDFLKLDKLIPGFKLDDFVFNPFGYSLNAIKGSDYLTIHITPQEESSYVSFESSLDLVEKSDIILEVFAPGSFDLMTFNDSDFNETIKKFPSHYMKKSQVTESIACGYDVQFAHFFKWQNEPMKPYRL